MCYKARKIHNLAPQGEENKALILLGWVCQVSVELLILNLNRVQNEKLLVCQIPKKVEAPKKVLKRLCLEDK